MEDNDIWLRIKAAEIIAQTSDVNADNICFYANRLFKFIKYGKE